MPAREIGSEFDLAPRAQGAPREPFGWVQESATRRLASGREALRLILGGLAHAGRSRLVLPAYLCDSVGQATQGAGDWRIEYVPVAPDLTPAPGPLASALQEEPDRTVFVEVQVFNTPYGEHTLEVLSAATRAGVLVVEDRTHSLLSAEQPRRPLAFASVRKWLPLPDGGLAVGTRAPSAPSDEEFVALRRGAMTAKHQFLVHGEGDKSTFLGAIQRGEQALDAATTARTMSSSSRSLLDAANLHTIAARRRANHDLLLGHLGTGAIPRVCRPLEAPLQGAAAPLGLPVLSPTRDALRRHLIEHRVYCPVHWPLPEPVALGRFPTAQSRNRELMTLVIDQRYDAEDMARVAEVLETFARTA
ncbi:MAG: hypothetical protein KDA24_10300 [Deltaproteobacteria bacterium]|nr:hypothetical protein [Deltaproteobacteria bacterium]